MEPTTVIRKPLLTEKSTFAANEYNRYTFEVDPRADKGQISRAIKAIYGVRVLSVATQVRKGRQKRNKFGFWRAKAKKQAVVKIHAEDTIELF